MHHDKIPQGGNMKKLLVIAALLALTFTAFGQVQLSAGAGASFSPVGLTMKADSTSGEWIKMTMSTNVLAFSAFVDATYVEIKAGYVMTIGDQKMKYTVSTGTAPAGSTIKETDTWVALSALGKYPFKVGGVEIFPLLGAQYLMNLSAKDGDGNKITLTDDEKTLYNQFWLEAGVGADFTVSGKIFVRPEALFGYKLVSKFEQDQADATKAASGGTIDKIGWTDLKLDIGVSVGFKL
jgi:hypothetical protein